MIGLGIIVFVIVLGHNTSQEFSRRIVHRF